MQPFSLLRGALLVGATVGANLLATSASAEIVWDMPNAFSRNSSDGVADVVFAELLEEKTNGEIRIVHHFDGSLGYKGVDHLEAVQDGGVPLARHALSYYGGYDPYFLLSSQPFLVETVEDVRKLYDVYSGELGKVMEGYNQVLVSAGLFPPSGIWSREPIESLADLQGVKIRAFDLNSLNTFTGAGAAAVNMNWGDVMPALSTGAIDAVVTSADLGINSGINDYLPNFTEINWAVPISIIAINKDVWDDLPENLQQAVLEAGAETTERTFERLGTQVDQNYKDMKAKDVMVITEPNPDLRAKLVEVAAPLIDEWRTKVGEKSKVLDDYLASK